MMNLRVMVLILSDLYDSNIVLFFVHVCFDLCFSYLILTVNSISICDVLD
jgi:hypothetical protein